MADKLTQYSTSKYTAAEMGDVVESLMTRAQDSRRAFERRWYDNNFFDDGHHFRYLSRQSNKIVDLSERSTVYAPMRAIPKSSRQIRGMANLLMSQEPIPVIYPEHISSAQYPPIETFDPLTGQMIQIPNPEYQKALDEAKRVARLSGHWLKEEMKNQDLQEKLALMCILTAKHGVSYMQIWPDAIKECIRTQVYDAFDIYLMGSLTEIYDSPFIIKATPRTIAEIKADGRFPVEKTEKISPDNKFASSEIKEAYMKAKFSGVANVELVARVIEKEAFIKEYLNEDNRGRIALQKNSAEILKGKKKGDMVMRHTFVAGNVELLDEYVNLPDYPFVDFRYEPGPIYQVPLMERFIPANKSLDLVTSRVERYTHTMVTGAWLKRQGEQFEISNTPGGQIIEYNATPPTQANIASIPNFVFTFMNTLNSMIEEQGVTTTALGKLPPGVKANAAIETLKESEFANLTIALRRLKGTVKKISEKFFDIADSTWITPQTVYYLEKGEPQYFDVIGKSAIEKRKSVNVDTPEGVVPLSKEYRVDIQIEQGMGYTKEGQRQSAKELGDYLIELAQLQLVTPEVVKMYFQELLETYGFGKTSEIVEAMETAVANGQLQEQQITQMKVAMAEVMNDLTGSGIMPTADQRIQENKVGVAETAVDLNKNGIPDDQEGQNAV